MHVGFVEGYKRFWMRAFTFEGRASQSEFWWPFLGNVVVTALIFTALLMTAESFTVGNDPGFRFATLALLVFSTLILLPTISLHVRRFHDMNASGGWVVLVLVAGLFFSVIPNIIVGCIPGTKGPNRFGPRPGTTGAELFD